MKFFGQLQYIYDFPAYRLCKHLSSTLFQNLNVNSGDLQTIIKCSELIHDTSHAQPPVP